MKNKPLCSILIPTYNRSQYLRRLLSYFDNKKINYPIYVSDGSNYRHLSENKNTINKLSNINVIHDIYPEKLNPGVRVSNTLKKIDTKYYVSCGDDDFLIKEGIEYAINFLEKHNDYTCAHGKYVSFSINNNKFHWKTIYPQKSVTSNNVKNRLMSHHSNYQPTNYSVQRTKLVKIQYQDGIKYSNDVRFFELIPSMISVIYGKIKKFNMLFSLRQKLENSNSAISPGFFDYIKDGSFENRYYNYKKCLMKHLMNLYNYDTKDASNLVDNSMNLYLKDKKNIKKKTSIVRYVKNKFSNFFIFQILLKKYKFYQDNKYKQIFSISEGEKITEIKKIVLENLKH